MNSNVKNQYYLAIAVSVVMSTILNVLIWKDKSVDVLVIDSRELMNNNFSCYIVAYNRVKQLLVYMLFLYFFDVCYIRSGITILISGICGILISSNIYYTGILNTFLVVIYLLPHFFVYYMIHLFVCNNGMFDKYSVKKIGFWIVIIGILVTGILCECLFSQNIMKFFYQYIVTKK